VNPVLEVEGATRAFDEVRALAGVDLRLAPGEWLGLLGPNGAGKTTLVRSIAGRVRLDAGTVRLLGESLESTARNGQAARRRLGVVPQEIALYPRLTAQENLAAFGALHGLGGRRLKERIGTVLDWIDLEARAREPIAGFSGGMKRRLNLACSVLHEPEVLLLDEPTVGIDPQSRQRIWEMLEELRRQGASLLLTTHQLDEAETVCDRIVILDHGRVIADGSMVELVARTVGVGRRVTVVLRRTLADGEGLPWTVGEDGRHLELLLNHPAAELPPLLAELDRRGAEVDELRVESPSLHAVFLHLTGRELRE